MSVLLFLAATVVLLVISSFLHHRRLSSLAMERGSSDLSTFVRSLDLGDADAEIAREVFAHLQDYLEECQGQPFPVQADDSFRDHYRMDDEDLDDLYSEVAEKLGISTERPEGNPYFEKVETVRDLVLFLNHQAKEL